MTPAAPQARIVTADEETVAEGAVGPGCQSAATAASAWRSRSESVTRSRLFDDHRLLGHGTLHGRERCLEFLGGMRQSLSSVAIQMLHVLEHQRAALSLGSMSG